MAEVQFEDVLGFKLFRFHILILKSIGIRVNPISKRVDTIVAKATAVFGCIILLLIAVHGLATTIPIEEHWREKDFITVAFSMTNFSNVLSTLMKYVIVRLHGEKFYTIGKWVVDVKKKRNSMETPVIEKLATLGNITFYYSVFLATIIWALSPLTKGGAPLVPSRLPFVDNHLLNEITKYVQFVIHQFMMSTVIFSTVSVIYIVAVLHTELSELGEQWSRTFYDPLRPNDYMDKLKDCIADHHKLMKVLEDVNVLFDSLYACQLLTFTIHFCSFNFSLLKAGVNDIASLVPLIITTTAEFGLLSWLGEEISSAYSDMYRHIYMTNWYTAPLKEKKCMVFVLEVMKKPYYLTGATVVRASLDTFVTACKQAFSLYTLMEALTTEH